MIPTNCPKCNGQNIRMKEATGECTCSCGHIWNASDPEPVVEKPHGRPIIYPVGTRVPGTHLTPINYGSSPPQYQCDCGETVSFAKSLVEGRFRRSCGQCGYSKPPKKCVFCKVPSQVGTEFLSQRICPTCITTLKEQLYASA